MYRETLRIALAHGRVGRDPGTLLGCIGHDVNGRDIRSEHLFESTMEKWRVVKTPRGCHDVG
jgi:hypothetical protein